MASTTVDQIHVATKTKYCHNEYKHNVVFEPTNVEENVGKNTYEVSLKNTRFNDPYMEYVYSSKSPNANRQTAEDCLQHNSSENLSIKNSKQEENIEKTRYDDKFYSKVYRNPILNKREKINSKKEGEKVLNPKPNTSASSYSDEFNEKTSKELTSEKNYYSSRVIPVFKPASIQKPGVTFQEKQTRQFYTSSYNQCFENFGKAQTNTSNVGIKDTPSKWRPLSGNLLENIIKGKYFDKKEDSKTTSNPKHQMDSVIYPFKN